MQRKKLEENAERKTKQTNKQAKLKMAKKLELNDNENKRKNRKINLAPPVTIFQLPVFHFYIVHSEPNVQNPIRSMLGVTACKW